MTEADAERFVLLLDALAEGYDKTLSAARKTLFFRAMREYDFEIIEQAFAAYTRTKSAQYGMPQPSHLIELIEGSEDEQHAMAWGAVVEAFRRIGSMPSVVVEDPALASAIARKWGSWAVAQESWGQTTEILFQSQRRDFLTLYKISKKQTPPNDPPVLLSGRAVLSNAGAKWFPARQEFGVILRDGTVEKRYIELDQQTGLPAIPPRKMLEAPSVKRLAAQAVLALPAAGEAEEVIVPDPDRARSVLRAAFEEWERKVKAMPPAQRPEKWGLTREEEERRKAEIRRQARAETNGSTKSAVRDAPEADAGRTDRSANHGGKASAGRSGTSVPSGTKMGDRSGVAGSEDRVRDRGGRVRQRDQGRSGHDDDKAPKGRRAVGKRTGRNR